MYLFKKLFIIIVDPILVKFFLLFTMVSAPFIPQPRDHLHVPIADIYSSLSLLLSLSYFKSQVCFSGIFILRLLIPYNQSVTNYLRLCQMQSHFLAALLNINNTAMNILGNSQQTVYQLVHVILASYGFHCLNISVISAITDVSINFVVTQQDCMLRLSLIRGLPCVNNMNFLVYIFLNFKYYWYAYKCQLGDLFILSVCLIQ